jgi:ATP-dependent RNA helicase RhlE
MRNKSFSSWGNRCKGKQFRHTHNIATARRRPQRQGGYIHPEKFIKKAITPETQEVFYPKHKFKDFGFLPVLQNNLDKRKYINPTPIQDTAIPHVLSGSDVIGLANTGTGKTAAFVLPIIQRFKKSTTYQMALIIAPTRELANQIDQEFRLFSQGLHMRSALCVGGVNIYQQKRALFARPEFVIGTPGRLKDLFNQGVLKLERGTVLVLDEVDRMLDMGFIQDIRFLVDKLPDQRQTLCFSATINQNIENLLDKMMINPITISVKTNQTSENVEQNIIRANSKDHKLELLSSLLRQPEFAKVLIFGQTKWGVQRLTETLNAQGLQSEAIHGNKSQPQRQRALNLFKNGQCRILVATDVAARGLDVPNVSHVINFDQPNNYEDYIHRIGRTGRAGNLGYALTFVPA